MPAELVWTLLGALVGAAGGLVGPQVLARLPDRSAQPEEDEDLAPEQVHALDPTYRELAAWPPLRAVLAPTGAVVGGLLGWARAGEPDLPAFLVLGVVGVLLGYVDIRVHRLPDLLTLPSLLVGAVLLGLTALTERYDAGDLLRAGAGALALFAFYLVLHLLNPRGMGRGDVKLAAPLGLHLAWLGWGQLVLGAFLGFLLGGLVGAALILLRRAGLKSMLPFGPSMLVGALVAVVWGEPLVDAYLGR
ncbi:MAG TPA: A24 family peptidase [Jiangellales bacterium]|nr:A24 family peptidase [Jiangellales bacterium]